MKTFCRYSVLTGLVILTLTSCLKDESIKMTFRGFQPIQKNDGWEISTVTNENMDNGIRLCKQIIQTTIRTLKRSSVKTK